MPSSEPAALGSDGPTAHTRNHSGIDWDGIIYSFRRGGLSNPYKALWSFIVYSCGVDSWSFTRPKWISDKCKDCSDGIPDWTPNKLRRLSLLIEEHHHHQHVWTSRTCSLLKIPLQPHILHYVKVKNSSPTAGLPSQDFMMYTVRSITRVSGGSLYFLWLVGLKSFPFFFHQLGSLLEDASVCSCISWLRFPFSPPLSFYFNAGQV